MSFPVYESYDGTSWTDAERIPDFQTLFSKILKPTDIQHCYAKALNIDILAECSVEDMLPLRPNGMPYLPSSSASQAMNAASYAEATTLDPKTAHRRKEYDERLSELIVENDLAFRTITKTLPRGTRGPRIAYLRKFYEGLESMSQYWDCSLDQYFEASDDVAVEKSFKRQRLESLPNGTVPNKNPGPASLETVGDDPATENDKQDRGTRSRSETPEARSSLRYKGRRTSTGRDMPDPFRVDTVKAFVEGTIWPFQCTLAPPRQLPVVQFNKLNLPVRQTAAVYRIPQNRKAARQGQLEGPMMSVQVRAETDFLDEHGQPQIARARLDLMREIGCLLQLAQERRREGKTETKPGEGQWWTIKPRWGGGPGGDLSESQDDGNSDIIGMAREMLDATKGHTARNRKRKTPAMLWKELKCGSGVWDPKTDYKAIGRESSSSYDEVRG